MTNTIFALVFILNQTADYTDLRVVDHFSSPEICNAVIERVAADEKRHPEQPQMASRLACMTITLDTVLKAEETPTEPANVPVQPPVSYTCPSRVVLGKIIKCLDA